MFEKIPHRVWALAIMFAWGGVILWFGLVRFDAFGLDEGAAIALLLNWSVVDQVASPVTTFGGPDFRALLFMPLGLYWSGSMFAAKVFSLLTAFGAAMLLYRWSKNQPGQYGDETALIATGLLLISPATLWLADSMGVGPYLIGIFGLGWILDARYRASEHQISSLYFVQTLLVAISVTLHPMGLAYPLALAWRWHKNPKSEAQKRQVWIGLAIASGIILAMQTGWIALAWFENPITSLSVALLGNATAHPADIGLAPGIILALLLAVVLVKRGRLMLDELFGTTLLLALVLGLLVADINWAYIALAVTLYGGTPLLIDANRALGRHTGFMGQRGLVMAVLLVAATVFMQADKAQGVRLESGLLSPSDEVIQALAPEATIPNKTFLAASQWPARSMLVVRADVLPLPPTASDEAAQLAMIKGVTHVVFDHNDPDNTALAKNFRNMTGATETLSRLPGGVVLRIRGAADKAPETPAPVAPAKDDAPAIPTANTTSEEP